MKINSEKRLTEIQENRRERNKIVKNLRSIPSTEYVTYAPSSDAHDFLYNVILGVLV